MGKQDWIKSESKRRQLNIALSDDVQAKLRSLAEEHNVTIAEAARVAIHAGLPDVSFNIRMRRLKAKHGAID